LRIDIGTALIGSTHSPPLFTTLRSQHGFSGHRLHWGHGQTCQTILSITTRNPFTISSVLTFS